MVDTYVLQNKSSVDASFVKIRPHFLYCFGMITKVIRMY